MCGFRELRISPTAEQVYSYEALENTGFELIRCCLHLAVVSSR